LLEEVDREDTLTFQLRQILHIEDSDGPDLAFLGVEQIDGDSPPAPIALAEASQPDELVAVIGYPARDSRIPTST
jgi:endonuclease G